MNVLYFTLLLQTLVDLLFTRAWQRSSHSLHVQGKEVILSFGSGVVNAVVVAVMVVSMVLVVKSVVIVVEVMQLLTNVGCWLRWSQVWDNCVELFPLGHEARAAADTLSRTFHQLHQAALNRQQHHQQQQNQQQQQQHAHFALQHPSPQPLALAHHHPALQHPVQPFQHAPQPLQTFVFVPVDNSPLAPLGEAIGGDADD